MPGVVREVAVSGGIVSVEIWGDGAPLVCLHGGMGLDASYLKAPAILGLASPQRQLLIPDQRGHGRSSRSDPSSYTHATWVADVVELCHGLGLDRVALLGHSYGGFIALELALRHAGLLSHLILVGTSAGPVTPTYSSVHDDCDLRQLIRAHWPSFFAGDDKHWEVFEQLTVSAGPFTAALHGELQSYDLRQRVVSLDVSTLLIVGEHDRYRDDMRWLGSAIGRSRLVVMPGVGHMPFLEAPERFQELVRDFLGG